MADKGPLLTSCVIFYLSIGAAIFQILEEPNWMSARDKYILQRENLLNKFSCLTKEDLDEILEIVSEAAGEGVTITGDKYHNSWDWANSVIFAATIVTTIGYGNVAPKTKGGRVFCILYGLCGIPLCLVWISELGSFFGDRAKRLSQVLLRRNISVKKVQFICTALFLLWGLFVHLVIPPFVFMSLEGWSYLEGIYFSFITLTTVGFGDYVAGVNPNIEYPPLYRVFAEIWIYMGLAWLSLFFSWNVHMVVKAHEVFRKRRHRHRQLNDEEPLQEGGNKELPNIKQSVIDIFNFLSEQEDGDYSTVIKEIGIMAKHKKPVDKINRSQSCNDLDIQTLDHSPGQKNITSVFDLFKNPQADENKADQRKQTSTRAEFPRTDNLKSKDSGASEAENGGIVVTVPVNDAAEEQSVQHPDGGETRFKILKVNENVLTDQDEKG
ncbi:potassium channel subfamily K member 5-like [Solea senegalensis]|uniref:Potassium channel subfamily K member 5-like n=1 Tax=Solea senegalensis TaxID=28829 RepID=A0AAV6PPJ0_SOLSE|nr:potassium channel subfamily K member 5-like isoform X2 [Solea senegalensis]KAG7474604.1 potassium channel subfamily K member 5-like [Solea senegalensis]